MTTTISTQTAPASIPAPRTEWVDMYPGTGLDFGDVTDIYEGE